MHTLRVLIYRWRGCQFCLFYFKGFLRPNRLSRQRQDAPLSFCVVLLLFIIYLTNSSKLGHKEDTKEKTMKDIDRTHIVALQEVNGSFKNVELPIERPEQFIAELKAMVDNRNRTRWDMQSYFMTRYPTTSIIKDYLHPYSYDSWGSYDSIVELGTRYPPIMEYQELRQEWEKAALDAKESYIQVCRNRNTEPLPNETVARETDAVFTTKKNQKNSFLSYAMRWIDACCYQSMTSTILSNTSIKMFSKENIGWNIFTHTINNDVVVELRTNFGYGNSTYFHLAIKYKDIAILPYSYIVKYYNANMREIVKCTRSYQPTRDSWYAAFDFICDFVNQSKSNPDKFVETYIMREVKEMMQGLESISQNPQKIIECIGNRNADPCVTFVQCMFDEEKKRMASYPEEMPTLFKVEKITGALKFLQSLTAIAKEINDVQPHINRLIELNTTLYPEVEDAISKIKEKVEIQNTIKSSLDSKITELSEQLQPFEDEIKRLCTENPQLYSLNIKNDYENKHPDYKELKKKKDDLYSELCKVNRLINDFNSFLNILNSSLSILDELKQVA